jgi:xanthine/uracil permease
MGLLVAFVMGLQHAFAMIGGIVTPPLLLGGTSGNPEITRYLVNASLICSGICTFVQVFQIPLFGKYKLGSGVLSVMGTSFTSLNLAIAAISKLRVRVCRSQTCIAALVPRLVLCLQRSLIEIVILVCAFVTFAHSCWLQSHARSLLSRVILLMETHTVTHTTHHICMHAVVYVGQQQHVVITIRPA